MPHCVRRCCVHLLCSDWSKTEHAAQRKVCSCAIYIAWQQEPCLGVHLLIAKGNMHVLGFDGSLARQLHGCARRSVWRMLDTPHPVPATVRNTPDTPHRQRLTIRGKRGALDLRRCGLHATQLQVRHKPAANQHLCARRLTTPLSAGRAATQKQGIPGTSPQTQSRWPGLHVLGAACAICCLQLNIALARLPGSMCPNPLARALSPMIIEVWVHHLSVQTNNFLQAQPGQRYLK